MSRFIFNKFFTIKNAGSRMIRLKSSCECEDSSNGEPAKLDPEEVIYGKKTGNETIEVGFERSQILSGRPREYVKRTARIFRRDKNVMQQGTDNTRAWILTYDTRERWENPNMGWASSGDSFSNLYMEFPSMCAAINYAEKNCIKWSKEDPPVAKPTKKSYNDNFTWNKRTRVSTK